MAFKFKDWFFGEFPGHHQINDTYKNSLGEGLLQRYLRSYGLELDEEFMPYINDFTDLVDIELTKDKYLPLLAFLLGTPPSPDGDPVVYRRILAYIIQIYKIKGTAKSYELFFNLLGLRVSIKEAIPLKKYTYDNDPDKLYDDGNFYDSECDYCSDYWIEYDSLINPNNLSDYINISQDVLDAAAKIICFLQPINAKFAGFIRAIRLFDTIDPIMEDLVTIGPNTFEGVEEADSVIDIYQPTTSISEGDTVDEITTYTFNLNRRGNLNRVSTIHWEVQPTGTNPASGDDFKDKSFPFGTVTFQIGEQIKPINVYIQQDLDVEEAETFKIFLSNPINCRIGVNNSIATIINDDAALSPLDPPTGITLLILGTFLVFDWDDITNADDYLWEIATDALFSTIVANGNPTTSTSSTGALSPGPVYYFRVRAQGAGFSPSAWSNITFGGTANPTPVLTFDNITSTGFRTNWTPGPDANRFYLEIQLNDAAGAVIATAGPSSNSGNFTFSSGTSGQTYFVSVKQMSNPAWYSDSLYGQDSITLP